jgi:hypothetical protein
MNGIWSTSPIGQSSLVCSLTTTYFAPLIVTRHFNLDLSDRENDPSSFRRAVHGRRTPHGRGVPCRGRGFVPPRLASSPIACTTTAMPKGFFVFLCKALSVAQNATPMPHDGSRQPWSDSSMPRSASPPPREVPRPLHTTSPLPQRTSLPPWTTNSTPMRVPTPMKVPTPISRDSLANQGGSRPPHNTSLPCQRDFTKGFTGRFTTNTQ